MLVVLALLPSAAAGAGAASPPPQPSSGPGGADVSYSGTSETDVTNSSDATRDFSVIVPTGWVGTGQAPTSVPVIFFIHGEGILKPSGYGDWITHLVRKGNIVVYPAYQTYSSTASTWRAGLFNGLHDALAWMAANLTAPGADLSNGPLIIGQSLGGGLAADYPSEAASYGLPAAAGVLAIQPGDSQDTNPPAIDEPLNYPAGTPIECLISDEDYVVGRRGCDTIWASLDENAAPQPNRDYIEMFSDTYGSPPLLATHFASGGGNGNDDALDWYGFWKLSDGLRDCVFEGTDCEYAYGETSQQQGMGSWSDGTPVTPMVASTTTPPQ
jgi:acetyl esterase/lipase